MKTFGDLFSGFGGVAIGAKAAGLALAWSVENNPRIAEVAACNLGDHIRVADVLECDPADFERVDVLHASPPCPNFSTAKKGNVETLHDLALAAKVAEFATVLRPRIFTLENVTAYRWSRSWSLIESALHEAGYWVNVAIVNAADYGVPQARRRMIVRAVRGGFVPYLPAPVAHRGWYSAVEDIINDFPTTKIAPWQSRAMPGFVDVDTLVVGGNISEKRITRPAEEPAPTITAGALGKTPLRAILLGNNRGGDRTTVNHALAENPAFTVTATNAAQLKAIADCRAVSFTPRGVARLMAFPDWYEFPCNKTLAGRGLGNAMPPLLAEAIIRGMAQVT